MNKLSLQQAEVLHRAIGAACTATGLQARYEGALGARHVSGPELLFRLGVWTISLPVAVEERLDRQGQPLFALIAEWDVKPTAAAQKIIVPLPDGKKTVLVKSLQPRKSLEQVLKPLGLDFASFAERLLTAL